jgi:hypothetical protein
MFSQPKAQAKYEYMRLAVAIFVLSLYLRFSVEMLGQEWDTALVVVGIC